MERSGWSDSPGSGAGLQSTRPPLSQPPVRCPLCGSPKTIYFCAAFDRVRCIPQEPWDILQCRDCRYGWTHPPLDETTIGDYYPPAYLGDTARMIEEFQAGRLQKSRSWKKETEKVRLVERYASGGRILDVGCADARFLLALDPQKWARTGVEFAEPTVRMVSDAFPDLSLIPGNIYSDRLPPGLFDVICFWHVLEHLPAPLRVLARVRELLKPGGLVFISLPNLDSLQARIFRRFWYGFDDVPRHLHHFSPQSLQRILSLTDLEFLHGPLFFSRMVSFHALKYSLINWSKDKFRSRGPYYALKLFLFGFPIVERVAGSAGIITAVAGRPFREEERPGHREPLAGAPA
ncbi:MAG: class I SAM-dependent methyltransferase [Acidobacteriota bacterium]